MPEIGAIPVPLSLRRTGVFDMVCVTDGRMSGTEHGAMALHVAPEAGAGGPIGLVRDGDEVALDANRGVLDLLVDERELARRAAEPRTSRPVVHRAYEALHIDHVMQADEGCDLDFLLDPATRDMRSRGA